jgi:CelD/BcsL family acetyltransferase involved in cellulose biosynthesis
MRTRLVRVRDVSTDDEEAWRRLGARALEPNPFAEPDFLSLSARHFAGYADTRLVIVQEGTEFLGVLPIVGFTGSRLPPRRIATTDGFPTAVSGLHTPLVDRTDPDTVVEAIMGALHHAAKSEGWPGIVLFEGMSADGPVVESLRRACAEHRYPVVVKDVWERATVTRSVGWENPVDGKRRREIGRRKRLLAQEGGGEVKMVDRTHDPTSCADFLAMEMTGWKAKQGGRAFARDPDTKAWFEEWYRLWVDAGRLIVLGLNVGSTPVATQVFVRAGEGLFCFRIAHDEAFSKYKPGAMLLSLAVEHLREHTDAAWIDSTTDKNNTFFLGMLPERRALARMVIGTGGVLDRGLVSGLPLMTKAVQWRRRARTPRAAMVTSRPGPAET